MLGRQVVQMARHMGIRTINVVRSAVQVGELTAIGADHVICSATEDVPARVRMREITGGAGAYGGIDAVAGEQTATMTGALRPGGRQAAGLRRHGGHRVLRAPWWTSSSAA